MRPARLFFLAAAASVALGGSAEVSADSLNDSLGPREIAVGESRRAEAVGSLSTRLNPAGLSLSRQLVFEGSYGFRPGDDASVVGVSACDSTVPFPGCFYYNYFTAEPSIGGETSRRRFHEFGMSASRAISPQLVLGLGARYFDYESELETETDASGMAFDLGVLFRASDVLNLAAVGHNLYAPDSEQYPRAIGTGLAMRPGGGAFALSADALWHLETAEGRGTGRYGGGIEYFFTGGDRQNGYPLRAGGIYDHGLESAYLTGGVGFATAKVGLDVGARKQVDGGDELMVVAALRVFGPVVPE